MIKLRTPLGVALATLVLSSTFLLTGCSGASFVTNLNRIVTIADEAVTVLAKDGSLPAPIATVAKTYLDQISAASAEATIEMASSDTNSDKRLKIAAYFAAALLPDVPAGHGALAAILKLVDSAVKEYLANAFPTATPSIDAVQVKFGPLDRLRLASIRRHANAVRVRIENLR